MVARPHEKDDDSVVDMFDPDPTLDPDRYEGIHIVVSDEEAMELFDVRARYELGISGEEFLQRWDSGEYGELSQIPDTPEGRKIERLVALIPFIRIADS